MVSILCLVFSKQNWFVVVVVVWLLQYNLAIFDVIMIVIIVHSRSAFGHLMFSTFFFVVCYNTQYSYSSSLFLYFVCGLNDTNKNLLASHTHTHTIPDLEIFPFFFACQVLLENEKEKQKTFIHLPHTHTHRRPINQLIGIDLDWKEKLCVCLCELLAQMNTMFCVGDYEYRKWKCSKLIWSTCHIQTFTYPTTIFWTISFRCFT